MSVDWAVPKADLARAGGGHAVATKSTACRVANLFGRLVCCCSAHAQDSTITIKAGTSFNESVSITDLYEYPQFVYGKVFFRPGDSSGGRLNYNRFLDAFQG